MSDFNTANDLASQLVWGCHYQSNEPCFKLTKIIFHRGFANLHCDDCGEPILHGCERAGVDEDGEQATYCDRCHESEKDLGTVEEL